MGIQPEAGASAEAAARREGVPVGEWLNSVINRSSDDRRPSRRPGVQDETAEIGTLNLHDTDSALARARPRDEGWSPAAVEAIESANPIEVVERTIRAIIEHLETSDRRNAEALRHLQSEIHEIALRAEFGSGGEDREETRSAISRIEARLDALADRFETIQSEAPHPDTTEIEERLAALAGKIQDLTSPAVADSADAPASSNDVSSFESDPDHISQRFADLASNLQSSLSDPSPPQELAELHAIIRELSAKVDVLSEREPHPEDFGFGPHIAALAQRIDAAEARFSDLDTIAHALSGLAERIEAAELSLHQVATARNDAAQTFERQFAVLAEQLEASRQAMVDAARCAAAEAAGEAVGEATRQAVQQAVRDAQDAAMEAAREAARSCAQTAEAGPPGAESAEDARIVEMLQEDLRELRHDLDLSDRKTETAFETVQTTLQDIAERLSGIEERRSPQAPAERAAEPPLEPLVAQAESSNIEPERFERPPLPEALAELRLPPLGEVLGPKEEEAAAPGRATDGGEIKAEEAAPEPEPEPAEALEESSPPREPESRPESSILSEMVRQFRTSEAEQAASAPEERPEESSDIPPVAGPEAPEPDVTTSLRGARTTSELLAAARRAAEAAARESSKSSRFGRLSLRERLRIPLSRHGRGREDPARNAVHGEAAAAEQGETQRTAPRRAPARKPIVLAVAAVMLFAGSVEIYNLLKNRTPDLLPLPAESSENDVAVPDAAEPEIDSFAFPDELADDGSLSSAATVDEAAQNFAAAPPQPEPEGPVTGSLPSVGKSDAAKSPEVVPAKAATPPAVTKSAALPTPAAAEMPEATAEALDAPTLPEKVGPAALRQAAMDGDAAAQFEVASRLAEGRGVKADAVAAAAWFRRAATGGLAPAQYRLGSLYERGIGIAKDREKARAWYERAAAQGNRKAMHNLAVLYADGVGAAPDFEASARWFQAAAELDLADSQYNLGILYARGLGVPQNFAESYKWFSILANRGDKDAAIRRDAVAAKLDAQTLAATKLAAQTWKAKRLDPEANAVRLPQKGWTAQKSEAPPAKPQPGTDIVRNVQKLLTQLGYQPGPVDGTWGPKTREAIESFQRDAGLKPTGALTPDLLRKLQQSSS